MNRYMAILAVFSLAIVCTAPAVARYHHHHATHAVKVKANLSGKRIYGPNGSYVGTVLSMSRTKNGRRAAVMLVEKRLGVGTVKVLLPVSKLKFRERGGYHINLTREEARGLPKAG